MEGCRTAYVGIDAAEPVTRSRGRRRSECRTACAELVVLRQSAGRCRTRGTNTPSGAAPANIGIDHHVEVDPRSSIPRPRNVTLEQRPLGVNEVVASSGSDDRLRVDQAVGGA